MRQIARIALLLFLVASVVNTAFAKTLYKSVGPDGVVSYSDQPPSDNTRKVQTINFDDLPITVMPASHSPFALSSIAERMRKLWVSPIHRTTTSDVVLYTASWCGYCKQAKAYLDGKSIKYQEIDVDTNDGKASFAQAGGGRGVPMIIVSGRNVNGFSTAAYDSLFPK